MSAADVRPASDVSLDISSPRNDTMLDTDIGTQPNPTVRQRNSLRNSPQADSLTHDAFERAMAGNTPDEEISFFRRIFPNIGERLSMMYVVSVVGATIGVLVKHPANCPRLRIWLWTNAALTLARSLGKMLRSVTYPNRASDWLANGVKLLTTAAMAWFVVGLVFVLAMKGESRCDPAIYNLALALVIIEMTMLLLSVLLALLIFLFTSHRSAHSFTVPGISRDAIEKLRAFQYDDTHTSDDVTCAICLSDYERGDLLRELPCASGNHYFHADCVDTWLREHASCPICREDPTYRQNANADNDALAVSETEAGNTNESVTASVVIDVAAAFSQEAAQNSAAQAATGNSASGAVRRTSIPSNG